MKGMLKTINLFYILYTVYIIFACLLTNLSFIDMIPAVFLMWGLYCVFYFGINVNKNELHRSGQTSSQWIINFENMSFLQIFILGAICVVFSIVSAKFYTGASPITVFRNLLNNKSVYYEYQNYFKSNDIATFSISKIPFILMMAFNKIVFVYSFITLSVNGRLLKRRYIIFDLMLIFSHVYLGLARGTNFEFYQLFIIIVYSYICYKTIRRKKFSLILIFILGLILVGAFSKMLNNRGMDGFQDKSKVDTYVYFDTENFLFKNFPLLSKAFLGIFDYLGYGLYYISNFINEVWLFNSTSLLDSVFPFMQDSIVITNEVVDVGVHWKPDMAVLLDNFGIIGVLFLMFILGRVVSYFIKTNNKYKYIITYLAFMMLLSLPIGNFLVFSSEIIMILVTVFLATIGEHVKLKKRINQPLY